MRSKRGASRRGGRCSKRSPLVGRRHRRRRFHVERRESRDADRRSPSLRAARLNAARTRPRASSQLSKSSCKRESRSQFSPPIAGNSTLAGRKCSAMRRLVLGGCAPMRNFCVQSSNRRLFAIGDASRSQFARLYAAKRKLQSLRASRRCRLYPRFVCKTANDVQMRAISDGTTAAATTITSQISPPPPSSAALASATPATLNTSEKTRRFSTLPTALRHSVAAFTAAMLSQQQLLQHHEAAHDPFESPPTLKIEPTTRKPQIGRLHSAARCL